MNRAFVAALCLATLVSCVGTTGSDLVTFYAYAAGPTDADPTRPYVFDSGRGYHITLTRAKLHVGAIYLNRAVPVSGAQDTSCILPGSYVAQVTEGLDVDAISPNLQPFPGLGEGTETPALAGEVWLTGGDVNAPDDTTVILDVRGTAERGGYVVTFDGAITIGKNRALQPTDPSLPGSKPICKQRIVSPIPTTVTPRNGGYLVLRIDPKAWFANVDFLDGLDVLPPTPSPVSYTFVDDPSMAQQPDINLYLGLRAAEGPYSFEWVDTD